MSSEFSTEASLTDMLTSAIVTCSVSSVARFPRREADCSNRTSRQEPVLDAIVTSRDRRSP